MNLKRTLATCQKLAGPYRITNGKRFRLSDIDPSDTGDLTDEDKSRAKEGLETGVEALSELQELLYAQDQWALLLIFQAMDAAGKDGAIKHVMSGVNPQGCQVFSFKAPNNEELDHDYLWRCAKRLPERGRIGIFNRSYYEEVLVVRVHPEILRKEKLPPSLVTKDLWKNRFEDIRNFEHYLARNGLVILKFFLHVSKKEQKKRFLERLDDSDKHWKFSLADLHERDYWREYQRAYEEAIQNTATEFAPWHVVPADNKWYTRIVVAATIVQALASLRLRFPKPSDADLKELLAAREHLIAEK